MAEAGEVQAVVVAHREATVRQIVREALEARGIDVHTTARGEEAIRLTLELSPAALLLSLELVNVAGWQVVEVLRREGVEGTLLVALTADARPSSRRRALEGGFDSYVTLPIAPFDLADRLEALGVSGAGAAAGGACEPSD